MVLLMGTTGLRIGEAIALRRRDVDLLRGRLHVARSLKMLDPKEGDERFGPPKNGKTRWVPVPPALRPRLEAHMAQPAPGGNGPDALLFTGQRGEVVRPPAFRARVFKLCVRDCLPAENHALRLHDLRTRPRRG